MGSQVIGGLEIQKTDPCFENTSKPLCFGGSNRWFLGLVIF